MSAQRMKTKAVLFALAAAAASVAAAQGPKVVASFSVMEDVVRQIGGGEVEVTTLMGRDKDPHAFVLAPGNVKAMKGAQAVFVNGLGLEPADLTRAAESAKIPVVVGTKGIVPMALEEGEHEHEEFGRGNDGEKGSGHEDHDHEGHDHEGHDHEGHDHEGHAHHHHHEGGMDPHVWGSPVLMKTYAKNVADGLAQIDPANREVYAKNLDAYLKKLDGLDQYARKAFEPIAKDRRAVVTAHEAFSYMGGQYGLSFKAPAGTLDSSVSAKRMAKLSDEMKKDGVKVVFLEGFKDGKALRKLAKEAGATVCSASLYSDSLSLEKGPADTYEKMFKRNVDTIASGLTDGKLCM